MVIEVKIINLRKLINLLVKKMCKLSSVAPNMFLTLAYFKHTDLMITGEHEVIQTGLNISATY
jgi:hypothetical protein